MVKPKAFVRGAPAGPVHRVLRVRAGGLLGVQRTGSHQLHGARHAAQGHLAGVVPVLQGERAHPTAPGARGWGSTEPRLASTSRTDMNSLS